MSKAPLTPEQREKAREAQRRFHAKHPEKKAAYYQENRERLKQAAYDRYHGIKNAEILEQMKEYRARPEVKRGRKAWLEEYMARHGVKATIRNKNAVSSRLYRSGLSAENFSEMLSMQNGICAVCKRDVSILISHIDHCHDTGEVRGVLCQSCNTTEGRIRKSGLSVIEFCQNLHDYLVNPPARVLQLKWKPIASLKKEKPKLRQPRFR